VLTVTYVVVLTADMGYSGKSALAEEHLASATTLYPRDADEVVAGDGQAAVRSPLTA
jgi:hypothetical protein